MLVQRYSVLHRLLFFAGTSGSHSTRAPIAETVKNRNSFLGQKLHYGTYQRHMWVYLSIFSVFKTNVLRKEEKVSRANINSFLMNISKDSSSRDFWSSFKFRICIIEGGALISDDLYYVQEKQKSKKCASSATAFFTLWSVVYNLLYSSVFSHRPSSLWLLSRQQQPTYLMRENGVRIRSIQMRWCELWRKCKLRDYGGR